MQPSSDPELGMFDAVLLLRNRFTGFESGTETWRNKRIIRGMFECADREIRGVDTACFCTFLVHILQDLDS